MSTREYCPRCQSLQNLDITTAKSEKIDSDGNSHKIVTKSYHCANCHSTVRSEDMEVTGNDGKDEH
jgi:hypothetical protein